jgi:transcriptional regulator with XRE-family HTH domain
MGGMSSEDLTEPIGQRLRRLRLERGLSQRELSGPGVSYAYISRIEAGTRQPSVKALRVLARKLRVSPEYLETGSELRDVDNRELRLADAELALRLGGEPIEVETLLRKLLDESTAAGDVVSARRAKIGLGVAAFRRGDLTATISHLEPIAQPDVLAPEEHADVYSTLGQAYVGLGETKRVIELFRRCLDALGDSNPIAFITFATYLSYALSDAGDFEAAREVVNDVLDRADHVGDLYSQVRVYWSAARLEVREGREALALEHIRHAIALLRATEDTLQLGRANVLAADIALADEEPEAAREHLAQAERLLGRAPEPVDLATLRTVQARWAAEAGLADEAVAYAREALTIGGSEPGESASATWALAEALAAKGSIDEACTRFEEAIDAYARDNHPREATRVCRAYATVLRAAGREDAAFTALERAADLAMRTSTAPTR